MARMCNREILKVSVCGTQGNQNKNTVGACMVVGAINSSSSFLKSNLQILSVPDADRVHKTRKHEFQIHPCALPEC